MKNRAELIIIVILYRFCLLLTIPGTSETYYVQKQKIFNKIHSQLFLFHSFIHDAINAGDVVSFVTQHTVK